MIKIFTFEPEYFNNNGDQGNLQVITALLEQQKKKYKFVTTAKEADFVLIGDCSLASLEHFDKQLGKLSKLVADRYSKGLPTLLVGNAYEYFAPQFGLTLNRVKRESRFVTTAEGHFGYRNSDNDLPVCLVNGAFIATSLFGPVLAKNPQLLTLTMSALGAAARLSEQALGWIEAIRSKNG
jgi:CobQ-like glutamine amidotransferase family enzyme